jgi:hypothetical protein
MKRLLIIFTLIIITGTVYSQSQKINKFSVSAGMGINLINTPVFNDYLRDEIPFSNKDSIKSFSVGFEVFGGFEYNVSKNFSLKLDYSYFIRSITYNYSYFTYDYFYNIHQPYLMAYYVARKPAYRFKFGAGAGYHFSTLEKAVTSTTEISYESSGPSFRGEIVFSADMSKSLESYISGFITGNFLNSLKESNGNILRNKVTGEEVNLSGFGIGARLGFSIKL